MSDEADICRYCGSDTTNENRGGPVHNCFGKLMQKFTALKLGDLLKNEKVTEDELVDAWRQARDILSFMSRQLADEQRDLEARRIRHAANFERAKQFDEVRLELNKRIIKMMNEEQNEF